MSDTFAAGERERRANNAILIGVIAELDLPARRATVEIEEGWTTAFLPWLERRAGAVRTWSPPTVGEQVVVLSPGGDPAQGLILPGVPSDAYPAPGDRDTLERVELDIGFSDEMDCDTKVRTIDIPADGKLIVTFGGAASIEASKDRIVLTTDDATIEQTANQISLAAGGAEVRITGGKIILFGDVALGGEGGKAVARVGDPISTQLSKILAGSSKVTAV